LLFEDLCQLLGKEQVSCNESVLYRHSKDESFHTPVKPNVVVFPRHTKEIVKLVEYANKHRIPLVPFGAGSGLEGQAIPVKKGISISFEQMNQIVELRLEDMIVKVQPGVTRLQLNQYINKHGLYFPIDPGADAMIGGMVATNASGTTAVRYGTMRNQVLDMEVVLANGNIIHTGSLAKKSSSGYHLNGLFVGSEGTLGIFTEITLRLHGIPEHVAVAHCTFESVEQCAKAAQVILLSGIPIIRMELVDALSIKKVNEYGGYDYPEEHSLFLEFTGNKNAVEEDITLVEELMREMNCGHWFTARNSKEREQLWKARHELAYAYRHQTGYHVTGSDVCVPISQLPRVVGYARKIMDEAGLEGGIFGHIGDGNFHTIVVFNPNDPKEVKKANELNDRIAHFAISLGGTCTGEHGVGLGKMKFQEMEHKSALDVMKGIKQLLDPHNILNPGKIFYQ
jgi:D-lactate dehydrogenase (cytochrome)